MPFIRKQHHRESNDATKMKLKTGDKVRISSATNPDGVWIVEQVKRNP